MKRTIEATVQHLGDYRVLTKLDLVDDHVKVTVRTAMSAGDFLGEVEPVLDEHIVYIVSVEDSRAVGALKSKGAGLPTWVPSVISFQPTMPYFTDITYCELGAIRIPIEAVEAYDDQGAVENIITLIANNLMAAGEVDYVMALTFSGFLNLPAGSINITAESVVERQLVPNETMRLTYQHLNGAIRLQRKVQVTQIDDVTRQTKIIKA